MSKAAKASVSPRADDSEIEIAVRMMLAALTTLPPEKRQVALGKLNEHEGPKAPKRGGEVLNNVIQLFREDRRREWTAAEVVTALDKRGHQWDRKAVFNALTYLSKGADPSRRILHKFGYGRYQLADGSIIEGPP
jgi:hypothetical protein